MSATYPAPCNRSGCGQPMADHRATEPHAYEGESPGVICEAYEFPEGVSPYFPIIEDCQRVSCGLSPEKHEMLHPHAGIESGCTGYIFSNGRAPGDFVGGGGGFGGGGATGGW